MRSRPFTLLSLLAPVSFAWSMPGPTVLEEALPCGALRPRSSDVASPSRPNVIQEAGHCIVDGREPVPFRGSPSDGVTGTTLPNVLQEAAHCLVDDITPAPRAGERFPSDDVLVTSRPNVIQEAAPCIVDGKEPVPRGTERPASDGVIDPSRPNVIQEASQCWVETKERPIGPMTHVPLALRHLVFEKLGYPADRIPGLICEQLMEESKSEKD